MDHAKNLLTVSCYCWHFRCSVFKGADLPVFCSGNMGEGVLASPMITPLWLKTPLILKLSSLCSHMCVYVCIYLILNKCLPPVTVNLSRWLCDPQTQMRPDPGTPKGSLCV